MAHLWVVGGCGPAGSGAAATHDQAMQRTTTPTFISEPVR
jgi:hypothetical protein